MNTKDAKLIQYKNVWVGLREMRRSANNDKKKGLESIHNRILMEFDHLSSNRLYVKNASRYTSIPSLSSCAFFFLNVRRLLIYLFIFFRRLT